MKKFKFMEPKNAVASTTSSELIDLSEESGAEYKYVELVNISDSIVFLAFNGQEAQTDKGLPLMPNGGTYTMLAPYIQSYGKINMISASGGETICITVAK